MNFNKELYRELLKERKEQLLSTGRGWWLPEKEDLVIQKGLSNLSREEIEEYCIREMILKRTSLNTKGMGDDNYLLHYVNIKTGEEEITPLRGNLRNQIEKHTGIKKDQLFEETDFSKIEIEERTFVTRYYGKIFNEETRMAYHTFSGFNPFREVEKEKGE